MRQSAIKIQAWWRGILARREAKRRREAANTIRRSSTIVSDVILSS